MRTADLRRPLHRDDITHQALVEYLSSIAPQDAGILQSVRILVRQLLPTGAATLEVVAGQLNLHPKTLQRRLADENTTFAGLVDEVREDAANNDLTEVLALAGQGLIKHNIIPVNFDDINDSLEAMGRGDMVGRAVIIYD